MCIPGNTYLVDVSFYDLLVTMSEIKSVSHNQNIFVIEILQNLTA